MSRLVWCEMVYIDIPSRIRSFLFWRMVDKLNGPRGRVNLEASGSASRSTCLFWWSEAGFYCGLCSVGSSWTLLFFAVWSRGHKVFFFPNCSCASLLESAGAHCASAVAL